MKTNVALLVSALALPLITAGCGSEWSAVGGYRSNYTGAATVFDDYTKVEEVSTADLAKDLEISAGTTQDISAAIVSFQAQAVDGAVSADKKTIRTFMMKRDAAQDRLLRASENRCGFYQRYLKRIQSDSSLGFGTLATVLGGVGSIVTGAGEARALSGAAGISSGVGAEVQKELFANLTTTVIVPGIEKRRSDLHNQIMRNRCYGVDRYTAGMAIADAIAYHNACSLDTGVAEAGLAMKEASSPGLAGLAAMGEALAATSNNQSKLVAISLQTTTAGAAATVTPQTQSAVSLPVGGARPNTGTVIPDCKTINPDLWTR